MLYSCSSLWLFLPWTCSHLLVNRLLLLSTIWFQSSALDRNGTAEGTVWHLPLGRLAASHAVGAFEHVCSIWHRRSRHTVPEIGVLIWSAWWWCSVLAVVLPRWPYPASPSTRFHVFGRACQVRRTAGPLLFLPYTADILLIDSDFGLNVHCYADDGQINK